MEILLDTDFIIKMARHSLLNAFDELLKKHGHATSRYRYLYEIKATMRGAERAPDRSKFASHRALNMCRSFVADGLEMAASKEDLAIFDELREVEGMDQGEAIFVAYMLREANALLISGDRKMIDGLKTADGDKFRPRLQNRIIHLNRIICMLAIGPNWNEVRYEICKDRECDAALYTALQPSLSKPDAEAKLHRMTVEYERSSRGLLRPSL